MVRMLNDINLDRAWYHCTHKPHRHGWPLRAVQATHDDLAAVKEDMLGEIKSEVLAGTFVPKPIRQARIVTRRGRTRTVDIYCLKEQVALRAAHQEIAYLLSSLQTYSSYGETARRSWKDALRHLDCVLLEHPVVCRIDLEDAYGSTKAPQLAKYLGRLDISRPLHFLITQLEIKDRGLSIGSPLSPALFAMAMLPLDRELDMCLRDRWMRYYDDFVVWCGCGAQAADSWQLVMDSCSELGYTFSSKSHIADVRTDRFQFLGYEYFLSQRGRITRKRLLSERQAT